MNLTKYYIFFRLLYTNITRRLVAYATLEELMNGTVFAIIGAFVGAAATIAAVLYLRRPKVEVYWKLRMCEVGAHSFDGCKHAVMAIPADPSVSWYVVALDGGILVEVLQTGGVVGQRRAPPNRSRTCSATPRSVLIGSNGVCRCRVICCIHSRR